jgi:site-specific recombinase XerD
MGSQSDEPLQNSGLRHAFATIGLHNGANVKEVGALMRHLTPLITMFTYAHAMEGVGREAVNGVAHSLLVAGQVANQA